MTDQPTNPPSAVVDESDVTNPVDAPTVDDAESQGGSPDPVAADQLDTAQDPANVPVNAEPADNTVTPPAEPDVTPTASETPTDETPDANPDVLLPTDGNFSDQAAIQKAQSLGVETPEGKPLNPFERDILRGLKDALDGIESWINHARAAISKLPQ